MENQTKIFFGAIVLIFVAAGQAFMISSGIDSSIIIQVLLGKLQHACDGIYGKQFTL